MPRGRTGCSHFEGPAGGKTGCSVREQPAEAAAGQHAGGEPDGAEEGWGGEVRADTFVKVEIELCEMAGKKHPLFSQ